MPNPVELLGELVRVLGEVLNVSSLRLGPGPTLAILGVLLALLQLVARPVTRWQTSDPGGLAGVGRAMALAAESGRRAIFSLGGAGVARATSATARLQTLAVLPVLGHVARAAARSGVPLDVAANDALTATLAASTLEDAHRRTATEERLGRSRALMVGEGRPALAGHALASPGDAAAAFALGGMGEEALLTIGGVGAGASISVGGTAEGVEAGSVLIAANGAVIGPDLFRAAADLRTAGAERTAAVAANRVLAVAIAVLLIGSLAALIGGVDLRAFLVGAS